MITQVSTLIVEDDRAAARLLSELLTGKDILIMGTVYSAEECLRWLSEHTAPRVILMDLNLPGISGIEATDIIKKKYPDIDVIIQTVFEDSDTILDAIRAGISGYILKASTAEEFHNAVHEVVAGGSPLSGRIARKVLTRFQSTASGYGQEEGKMQLPSGEDELTLREEEILRSLIAGNSYKMISSNLSISVNTVSSHLRKIYQKLRVNSRSEAVARVTGGDRFSAQ